LTLSGDKRARFDLDEAFAARLAIYLANIGF
jgi:hypothetical protein